MSTGPVFGRGAAAFYRGLAADSSRAYFEAHRDVYEQAIRIPLEDLADLAQPVYGPAKVFRPNRDVRFSKDKSPYKLAGAMTAGRVGGVYVQVSADGVHAGGGLYKPSREQLASAREAIAGNRRAVATLRTALDAATAAGLELMGPALKTAPRGYDPEHPQIDLLRLQNYAALKKLPMKATQDDITAVWHELEPLLAWVEKHAA